jgi:signal transduction histidine kinase
MDNRGKNGCSETDVLRSQNERLYALIDQANEHRTLLGQELHDGPAQLLTAALLRIEVSRDALAASLTSDTGEVSTNSEELELLDSGIELLRQCSREVRHLIENFGPAILSEHSLSDSLTLLAGDFTTKRGLKVYSQIELPEVGISSSVETAAYRIVQEALNNVAKHAKTSEAELLIELDGRPDEDGLRLMIRVTDHGVGFEESDLKKESSVDFQQRHGLSGMRRRATALGGSVQIDSRLDKGTVLTAILPLMGQSGPS